MEKPACRKISTVAGVVSHEQEAGGAFSFFGGGKMKIRKTIPRLSVTAQRRIRTSPACYRQAALACFQLSGLLMGLGKGLAGPHLFLPAECVSVELRAGFL